MIDCLPDWLFYLYFLLLCCDYIFSFLYYVCIIISVLPPPPHVSRTSCDSHDVFCFLWGGGNKSSFTHFAHYLWLVFPQRVIIYHSLPLWYVIVTSKYITNIFLDHSYGSIKPTWFSVTYFMTVSTPSTFVGIINGLVVSYQEYRKWVKHLF